MDFPGPGPCSERAWSLLRPMGAQRGGEPPHLPSLLASQPRRWPVQEVLGWGWGLVCSIYVSVTSSRCHLVPARTLRTARVTLHVGLQGTHPVQASIEVFLQGKLDLTSGLNWSHCQMAL